MSHRKALLASAAVGVLMVAGAAIVAFPSAAAAAGCSVTYQNPNAWQSSPTSGGFNTTLATVAFAATAADADGTVARVEFLNGTTVVGSDTTSPYAFAWTGVAAGTYSVSARAVDNAGATTTTTPISIKVNPPNTGGAA